MVWQGVASFGGPRHFSVRPWGVSPMREYAKPAAQCFCRRGMRVFKSLRAAVLPGLRGLQARWPKDRTGESCIRPFSGARHRANTRRTGDPCDRPFPGARDRANAMHRANTRRTGDPCDRPFPGAMHRANTRFARTNEYWSIPVRANLVFAPFPGSACHE